MKHFTRIKLIHFILTGHDVDSGIVPGEDQRERILTYLALHPTATGGAVWLQGPPLVASTLISLVRSKRDFVYKVLGPADLSSLTSHPIPTDRLKAHKMER